MLYAVLLNSIKMRTSFKDVAHLYLGVSCRTKFNKNAELNDEDYSVLDAELLEYLLRGDCEVKPILRPLSEMTRDENEEMLNACHNYISNALHSAITFSAYQTGYLLKKGFDLFELIPSKEAVAQHSI